MKTFKLFNFNRRTAMVQAEGCTTARQKIGVNPRTTSTIGRFTSVLCIILIMLLTLGVGQMWADNGDFYNMYLSYTFEGASGAVDGSDNNTGVSVDAGTLTSGSLILTGVYLKCWDDWGSNYKSEGGQLCYTNKGGSTQYVTGLTRSGKSSNNYEYQKSNVGLTIASYNQASGSYSFESWGQTWGSNWGDRYFPKSSGHYTINYKIAPPAVSGFTVSPHGGDGYVSGSGTSDDPYIIHYNGGNLRLDISGSKAHTDANSSAQYKLGSNSYNTTAYRTINTPMDNDLHNVTIYMRYKHNSESLYGAESSKTVYYKKEVKYTVSKYGSGSVTGGTFTADSYGGAYSGAEVVATPSTGYNFSSWTTTSGSGSFVSSTSATTTFIPTSNSTVKAIFTAKNYTVKLSKNGGDTDGTITTTYNSTSTASLTGATYAGHSCDGYFTAKSGGSKIINADGTLPSSSVASYLSSGKWVGDTVTILYAQWTEDVTTYTVNYGVYSSHTSYGSLSCATTVGSSSISSGDEVASGTGVTFTASPITGYEVDAWYRNSGCTSLITEAGYASTFAPTITKDTTVYVKFKKKIYTVTYSPSSAPIGCTYTTKPTTGTYGNTVTMVITPSTGYTVSVSARDASSNVVTISNPSANTYTFTQPASAVTVTVTATETMSSLSTSCHYDAGNPSYSAPSVSNSATTVGYATTRSITATAAGTGYTFAGWTLTNCTRTDGGGATANPITIRANGDGEAASVVANYEEDLSTTWELKGDFVDDFETGYDFVKLSEHSTESEAYVTLNLSGSTTYHFQVVEGGSNWRGNTGTMTEANCTDWTFTAGAYNNCGLTTTKAGAYRFKIDFSGSNPVVSVLFPSQFLVGSWDKWDEDDHLFDEYGYISMHLTAGTYEFKVKYNGDWYGLTDATYTASIKNYLLYSDGGNMKITVATEGDYVFGWNGADKKLSIIFPNDQSNAQLTENRYLYFDSRNLGNPGWNEAAFSTRFWLKNYASGIDYSHVDCSNASVLEGGVYYALIPTGGKVGQVQLNRMKPDFSELWDYTSKVYAIDREDYKDNCLKEEEGNEDWYKNWTPEWKTYCPPIRTSTLSDNSTTKITWQSSGGAGTSENPYLVSTSHSIEVQGAATQVVNDVNMTINYDFKVGGSSQQASASNTYSHTSLSNNTTYTVTMDSYNAYNGETGTKNTSATALYYKALDTYTVTNDLTNISSNGRSGAHAAAYNIAYSATLSVSAGYSLPTTITVKRGSTNITASCTYNSSTGALTIPAAQMTGGDITITAAGVAQPLTFTGETTSWSTASNWSPACVPTIEHDITINKPAVVDIEHAAAKSIVLNQYSGNTGKLTIQANKGLEVEGTIRVQNAKNETVVTTPKDLVLQSSSAGNASLIFANTALDDRKDSATVYMYSKAEIPGSGHWNWQYIGLPFNSANATYTYYGSYIHKFISNAWAPVANGETLYSWQGYSITNNSATTYEMEGELVSTTDDVEIELSYGNGKLIGNSWTAPINIESFTTEGEGATFTSTPATIYLFNTGNTESGSVISLVNNWEPGQYISIPVKSASSIGIPYIAPMQGFWISADTKAGSVTLKYDELVRPASERAIVAGAMRAPKREQTERPQVMKIFATGSRYSDRVIVLSREDFSRGFDNGWDGERMTFCEEAPSIYVINGQGSYDAVSSIPEFEGTVIGFRSGTNNMATISFDYDGEETLYLNDLRDQTSALISNDNTYEFSTSANDDEARFIISATPIMHTPTAVDKTTANDNKVQKIILNDHVYIIRNGRMYDATGVLCK